MATIAQYLNNLIEEKKDLAHNLHQKGVAANESETFSTLVPKVLEIQQEGGELNTSDATATSNDILEGKTAYINGQKVTGNIPTINAVNSIMPTNENQVLSGNAYVIGNTIVLGDAKLTPGNIRKGVTIFGVEGTYAPKDDDSFDMTHMTSVEEAYEAYGDSLMIYVEGDQFRTLNNMQDYCNQLAENHWSTPHWVTSFENHIGVNAHKVIDQSLWAINGKKIRYFLNQKIIVNGESFSGRFLARANPYGEIDEFRIMLIRATDLSDLKSRIDADDLLFQDTIKFTGSLNDIVQSVDFTIPSNLFGTCYLVIETVHKSEQPLIIEKLGYFSY